MSEYIPDHVLTDVLLRLPFDSLIRFRLVSKSWRDLIDSSYVTRAHSTRSCLIQTYPHPDSKIIMFVGKQLYAFDSVVNKGKGVWEAFPKQLHTPSFLTETYSLVGCCNGILCFRIWDYRLFLWNPFTRSYLQIPYAPREFTRHPTGDAFGYDLINDDYKVIRWFGQSNLDHSRRYELCIYSLKQKSWMAIRGGIPFDLPEEYFFGGEATITNGAVHWLVTGFFIIAFDLGTYEFRKVWAPVDQLCATTGCLNGLLSLFIKTGIFNDRGQITGIRGTVDIWVMKEYGIDASWTKLASIDLDKCGWGTMAPVMFIEKRGKLLLRVCSNMGKLVVYDVKTKSFSQVAIQGEDCPTAYCWGRAKYRVCVASFVSPSSI